MNKERIAKELIGYIGGIFAMGLLSKGVQFIEQRKERSKKMEEEKESREWKVIERMVKLEDGTFEKKYDISKLVTDEELQQWKEYSEDYYLREQGFYVARIRPKVMKDKKEVKSQVKKIAKMAGKATTSVMTEGVKRRVVYEFKDASRGYAKSSKDTEIFLKNNLKNNFKR